VAIGPSIRRTPRGDHSPQRFHSMSAQIRGNLTTSKWAKIAKCSSDTALRDITELVERGILVRNAGGGRSTSYGLGDALEALPDDLHQVQLGAAVHSTICAPLASGVR
jgi:hypothetical protein